MDVGCRRELQDFRSVFYLVAFAGLFGAAAKSHPLLDHNDPWNITFRSAPWLPDLNPAPTRVCHMENPPVPGSQRDATCETVRRKVLRDDGRTPWSDLGDGRFAWPSVLGERPLETSMGRRRIQKVVGCPLHSQLTAGLFFQSPQRSSSSLVSKPQHHGTREGKSFGHGDSRDSRDRLSPSHPDALPNTGPARRRADGCPPQAYVETDRLALDAHHHGYVLDEVSASSSDVESCLVNHRCSYLDRINVSNARLAGLQEDLGMSDNVWNAGISTFYVGYLIGQLPGNLWLAKVRPSILLPSMMMAWSICTICMPAATK